MNCKAKETFESKLLSISQKNLDLTGIHAGTIDDRVVYFSASDLDAYDIPQPDALYTGKLPDSQYRTVSPI